MQREKDEFSPTPERSQAKIYEEDVLESSVTSEEGIIQPTQVTVRDMELARKVSSSLLRKIQLTQGPVLDMNSTCQTGRSPGA